MLFISMDRESSGKPRFRLTKMVCVFSFSVQPLCSCAIAIAALERKMTVVSQVASRDTESAAALCIDCQDRRVHARDNVTIIGPGARAPESIGRRRTTPIFFGLNKGADDLASGSPVCIAQFVSHLSGNLNKTVGDRLQVRLPAFM